MHVISVLNYKGGVGKTTITACIAQALGLIGQKTLVIDNDSQQNLTSLLGCNVSSANKTIRNVYLSDIGTGAKFLKQAIQPTPVANLSIIPSSPLLSNSDVRDEMQLCKCLKFASLGKLFDYILIDNSPGIEKLQRLSIHASSSIFVPTQLSPFSVNGIRLLIKTIDRFFSGLSFNFHVIPNFFHENRQEILDELYHEFKHIVTTTVIPYEPIFDDCIRNNVPLFFHVLFSEACESYLALLHDLLGFDINESRERVFTKRENYLQRKKPQSAENKTDTELFFTHHQGAAIPSCCSVMNS